MPMYWGDYFSKTRHLTCEQHGAYLQLLGTMWLSGGSLKNTPQNLAKLTGSTPSRWAKISPAIMAFFVVEGDIITHERLMFELKKAQEKSIKRAVLGASGGRAKSLKTKEVAVAIASDLLDTRARLQPQPEPDIRKESTFLIVSEFESFWSAYPLKVAKVAGRKAYLAAVKNTPHEIIMEGVSRLTAEVRDPRFIPHASTWLNGQRWQDQIIERKPDGQSTGQDARQLARHENYRNALAGFEDAVAARRE